MLTGPPPKFHGTWDILAVAQGWTWRGRANSARRPPDTPAVPFPAEPTREISRQAFLRAAAGALAAGTVFGSVRATADPKTSGWPQPNGPTGSFTLVFDDEFSGTTLNSAYWNDTAVAWGNSLNGVTTLASNVSVNNGLTLTLSDASHGACIYTDPGGGANPGFTFNEGIVEARSISPETAQSATTSAHGGRPPSVFAGTNAEDR